MKKILAFILVMCFAIGCFAGCSGSTEAPEETVAPEATEEVPVETPEAAPAIEIPEIDLEKLYATHSPDKVVMTVDGVDVTWGEYFYFVYANVQQMMSYFNSMASYYGIALGWGDLMGEGTEESYASYVPKSIENSLISQMAIKGNAKKNNVELTQENLDAIAAQLESDIVYMCGEGATEEDFNKYLEGMFLPRAVYDDINRINYLYQQVFAEKFGLASELVSDEDAKNYLEENGYMAADHILLATIDLSTQQPLEESVVNEKKAQAEDIVAQLSEIKDKTELLKKFKELKDQFTEDSGAAYYPDGYIFTTGKMVPEFEETAKTLGEYELSGIVETSYGYHIMLGMPLDPDGVIEVTNQGTEMTGRKMFANNEYAKELDAYASNIKVEYVDGFELPALTDYVK